jgi:outer membrane protein TolC
MIKILIKYTIPPVLCFAFLIGHTQTRLKLSLQEAIDLGLKNRLEVQTQLLNIRLAENTVKKNKDQWFPMLEGSGNMRYNTKLQESVLPEGAFGGVITGIGPTNIAFGTRVNTNFSLDATQNIYRPSLNQDIKISEKTVALEKEVANQTAVQVKLNIAEAYYAVLFRQAEITILEKSLARAQIYLDISIGKFELGTLQENDVGKIKLDYQNVDIKLQRAKQNLALAIDYLYKNLNISTIQKIELTDSLNTKEIEIEPTVDFSSAVNARSEIKQLALTNDLNQLQYNKAASGKQPTVTAYANYSLLYQSDGFNFFEKNTWSPFNYLGVKLSIPILDQHKTALEQSEYKIRQEIGLNNWNSQKAEVLYELQNAKTILKNAQLNIEYAQDNYRLAEQIFIVNQQKYALGGLLYDDLLDTEKSLSESEDNLLNSTYDLLIAKVRWQKAKGE